MKLGKHYAGYLIQYLMGLNKSFYDSMNAYLMNLYALTRDEGTEMYDYGAMYPQQPYLNVSPYTQINPNVQIYPWLQVSPYMQLNPYVQLDPDVNLYISK